MGDNNDPNIVNKKQVVEQQSCCLFDDLIFQEILTRLPVKSIIRFKSVSKQWYSTLSSPEFANAHLIKSPFPHCSAPFNTLFIQYDHNYYLFSYDDDIKSGNFEDNLVKLDIDFDVREGDLQLTGCCNGLISLGSMFSSTPASNEYFIIWNPATRKLHKYESYGYLDYFNFNNDKCFLVAAGFGYVSSIDDYKYVRILRVAWDVGGGKSRCTNNIVHIFSLKENKWRKIDFDYDFIGAYGRAVLINEKLYWPARSPGDATFFVSFDLVLERFDIIKFNIDCSDNLGVMGGCLSICNYDGTFTGDKLMHILVQHAIVKSISVPKELRIEGYSEMVGFTTTDKFFVTGSFSDDSDDARALLIVDTRTKPMQYTTLLRFDKFFKITRYVPSLVSPIPTEEPSEA